MQVYDRFEDMLAKNATINPISMAQQYAVSFKKQLKNVDREMYTESNAPLPVRITPRPVSGDTAPSDTAAAQPVTLDRFKSLMDELNTQIKEIKGIQDKVDPAALLLAEVTVGLHAMQLCHHTIIASKLACLCVIALNI